MVAAKPHQQIELADIGSLMPHPDNPRQGDVGSIVTSIAVNGWWGAVIASKRADGTVVILAGEHRWRALHALQADGYTQENGETLPYEQLNGVPPVGKVPVIVLEGLTLAGERKILLADNRSNDLASYDDGRLAELLSELAASGDLLGTLFDGDALDQLLADLDTAIPAAPSALTTLAERAEVYNNGNLRQVVVVMTVEEFNEANPILDRARELFEVSTHSDAAFLIWKAWFESVAATDA